MARKAADGRAGSDDALGGFGVTSERVVYKRFLQVEDRVVTYPDGRKASFDIVGRTCDGGVAPREREPTRARATSGPAARHQVPHVRQEAHDGNDQLRETEQRQVGWRLGGLLRRVRPGFSRAAAS